MSEAITARKMMKIIKSFFIFQIFYHLEENMFIVVLWLVGSKFEKEKKHI